MVNPIRSFKHEQTTESDTWTITHGLNTTAPIVDCYVDVSGVQTKVLPNNVHSTNANTVVVTWTSPRTGIARVM
jgi:hypothetical protein